MEEGGQVRLVSPPGGNLGAGRSFSADSPLIGQPRPRHAGGYSLTGRPESRVSQRGPVYQPLPLLNNTTRVVALDTMIRSTLCNNSPTLMPWPDWIYRFNQPPVQRVIYRGAEYQPSALLYLTWPRSVSR